MTRSRPSQAPRTAAAAAVAATLLLASACSRGGPTGSSPASTAGNSPHAAALTSGAACTDTGVHTKHINAFPCATCHPAGGAYCFDVPFTFPGGTTTAGGTLVLHTATAPTTCTVACHFPKGAPSKTITWDTPGPLACTECHPTSALPQAHPPVSANATRADCQACHVMTGHMDGAVAIVGHGPEWTAPAVPANQGFHAYSANAGLAACQSCHGQDLAGGVSGRACAQCHDLNLPPGVASWKVNCVMCHGGTDSQTGAPPVATWGNDGDAVRVGAHTRHVAGSGIAPAFDCGVCHAKPADALSSGHLDGGTAEVTFGGIAASGAPTWNRALATCAVYCHGATLNAGGTDTAPSWTGGPVACGACHGAPPPAPHPVAGDLTTCAGCHPQTMAATGAVIAPSAGGKHLDGVLQAAGGHGGGWTDPASTGFHAYSANQGLAACTSCHGAQLDGGSGRACGTCHDANLPPGVLSWKTNCTMCHGGVDNTTGAPPQGTWGHETDALRVGAHTSHVTASATKLAYDCTQCHTKPADALSAGHVDGSTVLMTWGALARTGGANPSYDRATGTCAATYCHGNYSGIYTYEVYDWGADAYVTQTAPYAGKAAAPTWAGASAACDSCHGNPPRATGTWHSGLHGGGNDCQLCHPDATGVGGVGAGITNASLHVNGTVNLAPQWAPSCTNCH